MKIKKFIYRTPGTVQGLEAVRSEVNQYGVTESFYLIQNSNLEIFLKNTFDKDFKNRNFEDIFWFLGRYNVAIVNTVHLLEKFIKRDYFSVMNCNSDVNPIILN